MMTNHEFLALLHLLMCSDPTPVSEADDNTLTTWADAEARRRGFDGWVVAFHELVADEEAPATFLVSWSGGYEPVQYAMRSTAPEAWAQATDWKSDAKETDDIDVFRIDLATNTIERIEKALHPAT